MSAYNRLNDTFCSENETLLTSILKEEWGHEGIVVSDWGAVNEAAASVAAGMELEMPSSHGEGTRKIIDAVRKGELSESLLDRAVERLLNLIFKAIKNQKPDAQFDKEEHHRLARQVARETMVLLKNEGNLLPLSKSSKIAVIGTMAEEVRYQGGGSSHVNPSKLDSIREEMEASAGNNCEIRFARGYELESDEVDDALFEEAKRIAIESEVVVLFIGLPERYESEGYDRTHLELPANQTALIEQVASVQPNTVVVLSNGAPVLMPWLPKVKAVLEAYLGGQALGGAIADLLFGDANPSGKLAETFPKSLKQNPSHPFFPGEGDRVEYREGIFVGYRYYEAKDIEPLFPFGHGLSYTTFAYSDLELDKIEITDQDTLQIKVKVKNTGSQFGKEIIQLYVRDVESSIIRPEKELKGFAKVSLEPGEEQTVSFILDMRSFAFYNVELNAWHVETGEFEILIGASSTDIKLNSVINVFSTTEIVPTFDRNTAMGDLMQNPKTRPILNHLQSMADSQGTSSTESVPQEMMMAMAKYMPLRALLPFVGGSMTEETLSVLLEQFNDAVRKPEAK